MPTAPVRRLSLAVLAAGAAIVAGRLAADEKPAAAAPKFTPEQVAFYEQEVLPVLKEHCLKCHGAEEKIKGGLKLTSRQAVLAGGDTGPAFDPKQPSASLLLKAIGYKDETIQMPPKGKLSEKELAVLTRWVQGGLPFPPDRAGADVAKTPHKGGVVTEEAKRYWAYQPVKRPRVPSVNRDPKGSASTNPIDAFILAKLDAKGLKPIGPADRVTLARRAYYDLWGLPPTPEQVDEFVKDASPDAWEKLIDRLLASQHYGE
jgi:hypothetical protein